MPKKLCLMQANCQGEPLETLLGFSEAFSSGWVIRRYTNYTHDRIPETELENCDLFLYQHLEGHWGEMASERLLKRLKPRALAFSLPNMFFKGYWPLWTSESPMNFGDALLDRLFESGLGATELLAIYLKKDISRFIDIEAEFAESLAHERGKEAKSDLPYIDFILERWKDRPLFYTVNHPGPELLARTADAVLHFLGFPPLDEKTQRLFKPDYADFELPVHPWVAEHCNLKFITNKTRYNIFGRDMDFFDYVLKYIECRHNNLADNFLGYLQIV